MEQRKSRKPLVALILFICLNVLLISLTVSALCYIRQPLEDQLRDYEAAQFDNQREALFHATFDDPDWGLLADAAGIEDTPFEGDAALTAYMEARITQPLTYREVVSGKENEHRYLLLSGSRQIGAFTLIPAENNTWQIGSIELPIRRSESVTVEKLPGWTVFVNGVALDERHTIRALETAAEAYLPEGVHGLQVQTQFLDGLLVAPVVTAVDETGAAVTLNREPGTNRYTLALPPEEEISQALWTTARNAAVADATYALGALSAAQLKAYFDAASPLYSMIVKNPLNIQKYTSASVDENSITVSDYRRYNEDLFSARVTLTQNIIRKDGTLKVYKLDKTYFFTRNESGSYLVTNYTNEDMTRVVETVRLTFVTDQTVSMMVSADTVTPPAVDVPEGATFLGWATHLTDDDGNVTLQLRLLPDGRILGDPEPMTLYPLYDTP